MGAHVVAVFAQHENPVHRRKRGLHLGGEPFCDARPIMREPGLDQDIIMFSSRHRRVWRIPAEGFASAAKSWAWDSTLHSPRIMARIRRSVHRSVPKPACSAPDPVSAASTAMSLWSSAVDGPALVGSSNAQACPGFIEVLGPVDAVGVSLLPGAVRTYVPGAQTPALRPVSTRDHVSVMRGITRPGRIDTIVRR